MIVTLVRSAPDLLWVESDGAGNPIYICRAEPGSLSSQAVWQISKLSFAGSVFVDRKYANGSPEFTFVRDNRAAYSYS